MRELQQTLENPAVRSSLRFLVGWNAARRLPLQGLHAAPAALAALSRLQRRMRISRPVLLLDELVSLKIHGVTPGFVKRFREAGYTGISADDANRQSCLSVSEQIHPGIVHSMPQEAPLSPSVSRT